MKLGVLISGRGSNLEALLDARKRGELPRADFVLVLSNVAEARGLEIARAHDIPTCVVAHSAYRRDRAGHDRAVIDELRRGECEALILAGYMRIIGAEFVKAFPRGIINIHPSLLPSFPGLHAQKQAIEWGAKISGCTVHFVDEGMDNGPIILQKSVPVVQDDDEESLATRILEQEHKAIVEAVKLLSEERLRIVGRKVIIE